MVKVKYAEIVWQNDEVFGEDYSGHWQGYDDDKGATVGLYYKDGTPAIMFRTNMQHLDADSREIAASAWCTPETEHFPMYPSLAEAFAVIISGMKADRDFYKRLVEDYEKIYPTLQKLLNEVGKK